MVFLDFSGSLMFKKLQTVLSPPGAISSHQLPPRKAKKALDGTPRLLVVKLSSPLSWFLVKLGLALAVHRFSEKPISLIQSSQADGFRF